MVADALTLSSLARNGTRVVFVSGELDMATAPTLAGYLAELDGAQVILDLWDLAFVDSSGIHVIIEAHKRLEGADRRLTIRWARGTALRVFEALKLDEVLHFDRTSRSSG
jgi:anti-anti-sigma factor